jgi:hypothetical protein
LAFSEVRNGSIGGKRNEVGSVKTISGGSPITQNLRDRIRKRAVFCKVANRIFARVDLNQPGSIRFDFAQT